MKKPGAIIAIASLFFGILGLSLGIGNIVSANNKQEQLDIQEKISDTYIDYYAESEKYAQQKSEGWICIAASSIPLIAGALSTPKAIKTLKNTKKEENEEELSK